MHLLEYNSEGQFGLAQIFAGSDIPKYAILSHTWGADTDELTFQDLLNDTGQDKSGYQKLQFCGEQAKRDGLQYFWVDTCCIDKSSSAELQEAINSMFRWYQNATKCYVYLSDVSTNGHNQASSSWQSIFKASRWFTRGWTLQELIAPRSVEFFCSSRMLLGDKRSLQHLIHEITGIEISALHGQNLSDFTIDERMSWAKNRQTKREEDMAYCLLGIFDVHMPLIYGERSESAFRRLTEEIGKRPKKHTLDDSPVFSAADSRSGKRSKTSQYESSNHLSRLQTVGGSETLCQYPTHDIDATTRQSIVEQLYFPKIDERLTSLTAAQGKTCRWFLTKSEYLSWNDVSKRQDHEGFLWIKGNPGTGKSTLMKLLFEEAKLKTKGDSSKITLSFFFLARGTIEERTTTGLYRSLLHQLFEKMIELRDSLEWMTADGARGIERNGWSEAALKQTLKHAVAKLGSRPLMIFVDALDECDQKQASGMVSFFEELCELAEVSQVSLQICFSSRHYPTIVIQKGMELTLEDELGHMEDIQHYIKSKLRLGKSKQAKALRSEILQKSSSIFLWVVLVLDILNSEYTAGSISIKKISKRLNEIPPGLNDLFEMILKRDGENLEELQLCLKLILFATRPLKPQELYFATQIGLDEDCMGSWDQEDVNVDQMRLFVRSSSKGLAEVTKNKASDVQFIHESVRDFLLGRYETQLSGVSGNFVGHGHDTLKNCCLAQLNAVINQKIMIHFNFSRSNFWECRNMKYPFSNTLKPDEPVPHDQRSKETQSKLQEEIRLKFPFLDYSVSNILYHANLAQQNYIEQVDFLAKFPTHLWVFVNNYLENHEIRRYTDSVTILYLLAERNLANLIRKRPRKESCFDVTEQRYGPSILAALATGSDEAAQTLLKIEAETFPSNSLQHDLCKTYHPKNLKNFKLGRSFTYTQKSDLIFQLSRCNQEIPLVFKLSSDESWFGPNLNDRGKTLLIEAVERDQCIVATYLLEKGIDANCIKEVGEVSLLGKAVISGHANMVKVLLEKGAEVNYRGFDNNTPLTFAVHRKHGEIAKLLLEEGAEVNIKTGSDNTPLMEASLAGSLDIVKLLLKKGAKTDYRGYNNRTPLMNAAFYGRKNVVDLLLENDAEVNCVDFGNESPLMKAAATGHVNIMSLLLEKGAKFDCKEEGFALALLSNSRYGRKEMVEFLLQSGVDASPRDMMPGYQGWTPLIHAASNGNENIVKLLLENGAEINAKSESGCTPLYEAASWGHVTIVELLLKKGGKFDLLTEFGCGLLSEAIFRGHEAVVAILLKQSASTEVENKDNNGLLLKAVKIAISEGKLSILKLLLEKTPNINQKGAMGQTPLFWAISSLNEDMVKLLLDKGASIESRSDGGLSPLMHAILIGGHLRIVKTLLDRGADINAEDYEGSTPPSMIKKNSTLTYPLEAYVPELKIGY